MYVDTKYDWIAGLRATRILMRLWIRQKLYTLCRAVDVKVNCRRICMYVITTLCMYVITTLAHSVSCALICELSHIDATSIQTCVQTFRLRIRPSISGWL